MMELICGDCTLFAKNILMEGLFMVKKSVFKNAIYRYVGLFILIAVMGITGCKSEKKDKDKKQNISTGEEINEEKKESVTEEPVKEQSNDQDTQVSKPQEQEKNYNINSQWVIQDAVSDLNKLISKLKYDANLKSGKRVDILIDKELTERDVSGMLHDTILDLVEYDLYLEYQSNPHQSHPVVIDHTYAVKYKGFSADNTQHVFEIVFVMNEQSYKDEQFDSNEVVAQVTTRTLNNTGLNMSKLVGSEFTEARMIEGVQVYESTANSIESLTRYVENEIKGTIYGMKGYSQFRLEFYAKGTTSYTFILYLR